MGVRPRRKPVGRALERALLLLIAVLTCSHRPKEGTDCFSDALSITSWYALWAARKRKLEPGAHPALLPFAHLCCDASLVLLLRR